jgi:hypothetical protein
VDFSHQEDGPVPPSATTWSDAAGVFDHELTAVEWPLLGPGVVADVHYALPSGHRVFGRGVLERVVVGLGRPSPAQPLRWTVRGLAEPRTPVTITVNGSWSVTTASSALGDYFFATLRGSIAAGDAVLVEHERGTHEAVVRPLAAWALGPESIGGLFTGRELATTGGGVEGIPVDVLYLVHKPFAPVRLTALSSAGGSFYAPGPMLDRRAIESAEVRAHLPGAFELAAPLDLDRTNSTILLPLQRTALR